MKSFQNSVTTKQLYTTTVGEKKACLPFFILAEFFLLLLLLLLLLVSLSASPSLSLISYGKITKLLAFSIVLVIFFFNANDVHLFSLCFNLTLFATDSLLSLYFVVFFCRCLFDVVYLAPKNQLNKKKHR